MTIYDTKPPGVVSTGDIDIEYPKQMKHKDTKVTFQTELFWINISLFGILHVSAVYGLWLLWMQAQWRTVIAVCLIYLSSGVGVTAGAHRLWSHRSYKAKWPLRLILAYLQTMAIQRDIYEWSRLHRLHHKFDETDADPHNIKRGFFFAHIGWLLQRMHPEVDERSKTLDYSDLMDDPIVKYQKRFYVALVALIGVVIPTLLPWYFWNESLWVSCFTCFLFRYCFSLHIAFMVNSVAHMWGHRPYDRQMKSFDNFSLSLSALGEGWHNYHHTFPWDYKTSELPYSANFTTAFIDFCAALGLAYDLKTVSKDVIQTRVRRTGDGTHKVYKQE